MGGGKEGGKKESFVSVQSDEMKRFFLLRKITYLR